MSRGPETKNSLPGLDEVPASALAAARYNNGISELFIDKHPLGVFGTELSLTIDDLGSWAIVTRDTGISVSSADGRSVQHVYHDQAGIVRQLQYLDGRLIVAAELEPDEALLLFATLQTAEADSFNLPPFYELVDIDDAMSGSGDDNVIQ